MGEIIRVGSGFKKRRVYLDRYMIIRGKIRDVLYEVLPKPFLATYVIKIIKIYESSMDIRLFCTDEDAYSDCSTHDFRLERKLFIDIEGCRLFCKRDVPLIINSAWMCDSFKAEIFRLESGSSSN